LNYTSNSKDYTVNFQALGLSNSTAYTVRELWNNAKTTNTGSWSSSVNGKDAKMLKIFTGKESEGDIDPPEPPEPTETNPPTSWTKLDNPLSGGSLPAIGAGMMIWGDYNNDGFLDAFIVGGQENGDKTVGLYKNNGNSTFSTVSLGAEFTALARASATFIDYDNDGNLDVVVIGGAGTPTAALYKNAGAPNYTFSKVNNVSFPPVGMENDNHNPRTIQAFDYNNDGWTDLIINGHAGTTPWQGNARVVALFKNNQGTFEYQSSPVGGSGFRAVNGSSVNVGDVNNDGYPDILVSGYLDGSGGVTDLYLNNKNGGFTRATQPTFTGHQEGETFFADINNDGWMDIIEIGRDLANGWNGFSNLYINNKNGGFTRYSNPFSGGSAVVSVGDVNNDGWTDLFAMGYATGSKFLYNKGDNTFNSVDFSVNVRGGFNNFVDFNNDYSLDFSIFGWSDNADSFHHAFYRNDRGNNIPANQPPVAPTGLKVVKASNKYQLNWNKATDDHTPTDAIRYNVLIDYKNGKKYFYVPSDPTTGKIKVNGLQPFITSNSIELNLPEGNYEFQVQAVDQAGAGSAWTSVGTGIELPDTVDAGVSASDGNIRITNHSSGNIPYSILSVSGQIIQSGICFAGSTLSSSALKSGIYLVKLVQQNTVKTVKVLVF
jgi:hypothetical protein